MSGSDIDDMIDGRSDAERKFAENDIHVGDEVRTVARLGGTRPFITGVAQTRLRKAGADGVVLSASFGRDDVPVYWVTHTSVIDSEGRREPVSAPYVFEELLVTRRAEPAAAAPVERDEELVEAISVFEDRFPGFVKMTFDVQHALRVDEDLAPPASEIGPTFDDAIAIVRAFFDQALTDQDPSSARAAEEILRLMNAAKP